MNKEEHYVRFNTDGTVEHVIETRSYRNMTEDIAAKLTAGATKHIKKVFMHDGTAVGLISTNTEMFAYKFLSVLKLNSSFKILADKTLRPIFLSSAEKTSLHPQFVGQWVVPQSMRLMFAAKIKKAPDESYMYAESKNACLLIAWDEAKRPRRLPLPNLYDNCYMCMGEYNGRGPTICDAFTAAANQMDKAEWNSDLLNESRVSGADHMFQFKPSEDGLSMASMAVSPSWINICPVGSTSHTDLLSGAL